MNPAMDILQFIQGEFDIFSLGHFLGPVRNEEEIKRANEQGKRLLEHFAVIPTANYPVTCPACGGELRTRVDAQRYGWRFFCRNHPRILRYSPLSNTFLQQARLRGEMTANKIIKLIYMWVRKNPLSVTQEELHIAKDTAVAWYGYCRDVACAIAWHDFERIGGDMDVVEVDETHLFKRKFNVGRANDWTDVWVVGGISRTTKKRFAVIVSRRDADTMMPILHQCIDDESYVCTDMWRAYGDVGMVFNGHGMVNHSTNFMEPPRVQPPIWMPAGRFNDECLDKNWNQPPHVPGMQPFRIHTQTIERAWRDLKEHIRSVSSREYASQYVGEWMY